MNELQTDKSYVKVFRDENKEPRTPKSAELQEEEAHLRDAMLEKFSEINVKSKEFIEEMKNYPQIVENFGVYYENCVKIYEAQFSLVEADFKNRNHYIADAYDRISKRPLFRALQCLKKTAKEVEYVNKSK